MSQNRGLKVLFITVVAVMGLILINSRHKEETGKSDDPNNFNEAIVNQFNDNIRDVAARLQDTEKKLSALQHENKRLNQKINKPQTDKSQAFKQEIDDLKAQLSELKSIKKSSYPIDGSNAEISYQIKDLDALIEKSPQANNELSESNASIQDIWNKQKQDSKPQIEPFYTIPAGSDITDVTLLSSLIGEVPVDGKLMQPLFPFSAMVNTGDFISANGQSLPQEITGMKVMGYAIGVGSFLDDISCVRAYATSILFVFEDGHYVIKGTESMRSSSELINNDSLGYLTNAYGNPCIKGQYITNAPKVLSTLTASSGFQGLGKALSNWQISYQTQGDVSTATPTGSMGRAALGQGINDGSQKLTDWVDKRLQGSFDMVYVPASINQNPTHLNLHLTKTIEIDKALQGRVLDYGQKNQTYIDKHLR